MRQRPAATVRVTADSHISAERRSHPLSDHPGLTYLQHGRKADDRIHPFTDTAIHAD